MIEEHVELGALLQLQILQALLATQDSASITAYRIPLHGIGAHRRIFQLIDFSKAFFFGYQPHCVFGTAFWRVCVLSI